MKTDDLLIQLYENYDKLLKICYYFGLSRYSADDSIQNFFLNIKIKDKPDIYYDDGLNWPYIFICLRNQIFNEKKKNKNYIFVDLFDMADIDNTDNYRIEIYDKILNDINDIRNWFDSRLAFIFYDEKHTIHSLAKATGIKAATIYYHLEKAHKILRKKYSKNMSAEIVI